jgi:hypothetical protein
MRRIQQLAALRAFGTAWGWHAQRRHDGGSFRTFDVVIRFKSHIRTVRDAMYVVIVCCEASLMQSSSHDIEIAATLHVVSASLRLARLLVASAQLLPNDEGSPTSGTHCLDHFPIINALKPRLQLLQQPCSNGGVVWNCAAFASGAIEYEKYVLAPGPSTRRNYASARNLIPMYFVPPFVCNNDDPVSSTCTFSRRRGVNQGSTKRNTVMPAAHPLTPQPYLPRNAPKAEIAATAAAAKRYTWPLRCLASGVPRFEAMTA